MKLQQLLEALKPSQYRNLVKGWDKSKYADLFGGKYRIYIPLGEKAKTLTPNHEVEQAVKEYGFEIEDYLTGIASKDNGKRKIRIGKLLTNEPSIKKIFDNDPARDASQSEYIVVISRHPYDIAGMTSGRDWEFLSCMNLEDGQFSHHIPLDIKEGTLVAYLIKDTDKNIESPAARVLIKPFVDVSKKETNVVFGVEKHVYGNAPIEFQQTVVDWADSINKKKKLNGVFELNPKLYYDGGERIKIEGDTPDTKIILQLVKNPYSINDIKKPTEEMQITSVSAHGDILADLIDMGIVPSEKVQKAALYNNGTIIQYLYLHNIIPSEETQFIAVRQNGGAIEYIPNPSEKLQLESLRQNVYNLKYFIRTATKKVLDIARAKNNNYVDKLLKELEDDDQLLRDLES
jgi:hypothetical protein